MGSRRKYDRPMSRTAFSKRFPDDAACAAHLFEKRWPNGFVCPACKSQKEWALVCKPASAIGQMTKTLSSLTSPMPSPKTLLF